MELADRRCRPYTAGEPPLTQQQAAELARQTPHWSVREQVLERELVFSDFHEAMGFVNQVADLAETEDHHPDIHVSWNKVRLALTTHKVGGLSLNDFILAAKVDRLLTQA